MKIHFLPLAEKELEDAFIWYEQQVSGLGFEFLDEINRVLHRILAYPDSCAEINPEFKRVIVKRFPFGIIFRVDGNTIMVVAVAHLHRKPYYWADRTF